MKATLETTEPSKQLRMCDLEPGDIAEILEDDRPFDPHRAFRETYQGTLVAVSAQNIAVEIGGNGRWWDEISLNKLPVRRLTPGEKIVIS